MSTEGKREADWWPEVLAHISRERPWDANPVTVAEIKSFEGEHSDYRFVLSALVPISSLDEIKGYLRGFDTQVTTSGPHPFFSEDHPYSPNFWIEYLRNGKRLSFEPLVRSWHSHDKLVLQIDDAFSMTYGLAPRNGGPSQQFWDDPQAPTSGVVESIPASTWDFPKYTEAFVRIKKEYVEDYLAVRRVALVQIINERRWCELDEELAHRLGKAEVVDVELNDRHFRIARLLGSKNVVSVEVRYARILAVPGRAPISENPLDSEGLLWPGIERPVTNGIARGLRMDTTYVRDTVLRIYEGRSEYRISPETGGVSFGNQWSVGFCRRVGRDLIQLEIRKLYEGAPPSVIRHWNAFSVPAPTVDEIESLRNQPNVATRARSITLTLVHLGQSLVEIGRAVGVDADDEGDIVGLREAALAYYGWWTPKEVAAITRHIPLDLTEDGFIDRCMDIAKLTIEGLNEAYLRKLASRLGVPPGDIEDLRSLKLLDLIVRLCMRGRESGLDIASQGNAIYRRLDSGEVPAPKPLAGLFAILDLRQLKGHRADASYAKRRDDALARLEIPPGEAKSGYGIALDRAYDRVITELSAACEILKTVA